MADIIDVVYKQPKYLVVAQRGRKYKGLPQRLEPNLLGICNCLTSVQKDNLILEIISND